MAAHAHTLVPLPRAQSKYKTLIIGTGSELWKAHAYSSRFEGCTTQGGLADAFQPITSLGLGLPDWTMSTNCDVFTFRCVCSACAAHTYLSS